MDAMSMSLEDIIKKNKTKKGVAVKRVGKAPGKGPLKKPTKGVQKSSPPKKIVDARMKLISKNRQKIVDAREVIADHTRSTIRDARELLSSRKKPQPKARPAKIPQSRSAALLALQNDMMIDDDDDLDFEDLKALKAFKTQPVASLRRTVKNDIFRNASPPLRHMPRLPKFSIDNHREPSPSSDPFDCYVVPTRRPLPPPPAPPRVERSFHHHASKMSAHMDAYIKNPSKSILRQSSRGDEHDDRFEDDRYMAETRGGLSSSSSSRYANESAGIFAKVAEYRAPSRAKGYRIIISNLVPSVTESDVEELFSEIGDLVSAKLIKLGTAEVIFANKGDDERAHDIYHNRLIDGEPMKITLAGAINKSSSASSAAYYRS